MTPAPPDVPGSPLTLDAVVNYLRRLSTWAYTRIDDKVDKKQAVNGLLVRAQNGGIYRIAVRDDGVITSTPIAPVTGQPGTTVAFTPLP